MKVHWLIPGSYSHLDELRQSHLASIRLRCGVAAQYSRQAEIEISFGDALISEADILLIGKIGADLQSGRNLQWLDTIKKFKAQGKKVILDYTDHHLGFDGPMSDFYRNAISLADSIVVPSAHMATLLAEFWRGDIHTIADAIEIPVIPPKTRPPAEPPTVLWFGHASNISYLVDFLEQGLTANDCFRLIVLSNHNGLVFLDSRGFHTPARIEAKLAEWSVDNMLAAARQCDACIIPSDANDPKKSGASSNRLITAFALGLPTAAENLASYAPYAQYFFDIRKQPFQSFVTDIPSHVERITRAQENVVPHFQPAILGAAWTDLFNATTRA